MRNTSSYRELREVLPLPMKCDRIIFLKNICIFKRMYTFNLESNKLSPFDSKTCTILTTAWNTYILMPLNIIYKNIKLFEAVLFLFSSRSARILYTIASAGFLKMEFICQSFLLKRKLWIFEMASSFHYPQEKPLDDVTLHNC